MKHVILIAVAVIFLTIPLFATSVLRCNFGEADITPQSAVVLAGFAARKGLSTEIHTALKTKCLVIENNTKTTCIISNDLMEMSIDDATTLRKEIAAKSGIPFDHIFIHQTHTHSSPRISGRHAAKGSPNYEYAKNTFETIITNALKTIQDKDNFITSSIEVGKGQCCINTNRRDENSPCDHDVYVARFIDKQTNLPVVSLINYSCHPVSLNHQSLYVSADFPGVCSHELSKSWNSPVIYFTGASGNVNPLMLKADTAYTRQIGSELADAVRAISYKKQPENCVIKVINKDVRLPFKTKRITEKIINNHAAEITKRDVSPTWKNDVESWRAEMIERIRNREIKNYLPVHVDGANIGGVVLLFSQGEPFNEYQRTLREKFPGIPIIFAAYTNGQNAYLPTENAFNDIRYDYEINQMYVYVKSPYPFSPRMPDVYESALKRVVTKLTKK